MVLLLIVYFMPFSTLIFHQGECVATLLRGSREASLVADRDRVETVINAMLETRSPIDLLTDSAAMLLLHQHPIEASLRGSADPNIQSAVELVSTTFDTLSRAIDELHVKHDKAAKLARDLYVKQPIEGDQRPAAPATERKVTAPKKCDLLSLLGAIKAALGRMEGGGELNWIVDNTLLARVGVRI